MYVSMYFLTYCWCYVHAQNSVFSFWPFVDTDTTTNFVVSSLPMLFLPKYIYCSKIT